MPMIDADTERLRAFLLRLADDKDAMAKEAPRMIAAILTTEAATLRECAKALDTIAELRRAEAEAYERAAKVCEANGSFFAAHLVRALTKQQDTETEPS